MFRVNASHLTSASEARYGVSFVEMLVSLELLSGVYSMDRPLSLRNNCVVWNIKYLSYVKCD